MGYLTPEILLVGILIFAVPARNNCVPHKISQTFSYYLCISSSCLSMISQSTAGSVRVSPRNPPIPNSQLKSIALDRHLNRHHLLVYVRTLSMPPTGIFPLAHTQGIFLAHYWSSKQVCRTIYARCGTNISYAHHPMPEGYLSTLDVLLGTVDCEDLGGIRPERHVWWDHGMDWTRRLLTEGDGWFGDEMGGGGRGVGMGRSKRQEICRGIRLTRWTNSLQIKEVETEEKSVRTAQNCHFAYPSRSTCSAHNNALVLNLVYKFHFEHACMPHNHLLRPQYPRPFPPGGLLLFVPLFERCGRNVVAAHIVIVFHFVDPDDPVLRGESLLEGAELRSLGGKAGTANAVGSLSRGKERAVVVVGHFVPGDVV